jgi:hypothetical protein
VVCHYRGEGCRVDLGDDWLLLGRDQAKTRANPPAATLDFSRPAGE